MLRSYPLPQQTPHFQNWKTPQYFGASRTRRWVRFARRSIFPYGTGAQSYCQHGSCPKTRDNHRLTFRFGHARRKFFSNAPVKVSPVRIRIEHSSFINLRHLRIENNPNSVLMLLQVREYMVYCFEGSPTRQRLMLGQL